MSGLYSCHVLLKIVFCSPMSKVVSLHDIVFTPKPFKALGYCFHPWRPAGRTSGRAGGRAVGWAVGRVAGKYSVRARSQYL